MRRALTLWPEWAWAITQLDKRVENRGWDLPIGEWIGLHAGKNIGGRPGAPAQAEGLLTMARTAQAAGWNCYGNVGAATFVRGAGVDGGGLTVPWLLDEIPTSALVGAIRVLSVDAPGQGDLEGWRVPDEHGHRLEVRRLARPIPIKGAQGLWTLPPDIIQQAKAIGSARTL